MWAQGFRLPMVASAEYQRVSFEKYVALNPTATPRSFAAVGEPAATADLDPYDQLLKTRFYRELAKPQGLVDFVSIFLEKAALLAADGTRHLANLFHPRSLRMVIATHSATIGFDVLLLYI